MPEETKRCLTPKCINKTYKGGLCLKCYSQAKKLVESGKTTWDRLEEIGLYESESDLFRLVFEERNKGQKEGK